ncbi:MAG: hypothetical protein ABI837_11880 [Acidobacteriota bacterium]
MRFSTVAIDGLGVTGLFAEAAAASVYDSGTLEATLWRWFPVRLAERGFAPERFIDLYENLHYEKPLILGLREALPQTRLVSFQHAVPAPQLLSLFVTAGEAEYAPLPDLVITSGCFFRDILIREGLPSERVMAGPAIRYQYLLSERGEARPSRRRILVTLPLPIDDALELLLKTIDALGGTDLNVTVKPHPMMAFPAVMSAAGVKDLPGNFQLITGPMAKALEGCDVVVALSSSTVFETWCAGLPVVIVGRESAIDQNPMEWLSDRPAVVYEVGEIRQAVETMLLQPGQTPTTTMLHEFFNPVNDSTLGAFLG